MAEAPKPYPRHLYDTNRINLARMILEKEFRKLFLGQTSGAWQEIDKCIADWSNEPTRFHLEDDGPRDFWDVFAALMESVKLKPNFTSLITSENVSWQKKTMQIKDIQMTSPLEQLKKVPGLNLRNDLPFAELNEVLASNSEAIAEQKRLVDAHSTDPAQDEYPVILKEADSGLFKVMDGNRRTLRALLYGKDSIEAWVGTTSGNEPKNYWVPLNDMFQVLKIYKQAADSGDTELKRATALVLKARFQASEVAEIAYQNRIGNQAKIAKELFELAQSL